MQHMDLQTQPDAHEPTDLYNRIVQLNVSRQREEDASRLKRVNLNRKVYKEDLDQIINDQHVVQK